MHSVLLVQTSLQPPGGGNGLAAWMVEALRRDYRLTVLTWEPVVVEAVNRYWGTSLRPGEFSNVTVSAPLRGSVAALPVPLYLLRISLLVRLARKMADQYDLLVSASNEADFGRPGIQYVHYPAHLRPRPRADIRWYHRSRPLLTGYYRMCDWLFGTTSDRVSENLTLVNSDWTGVRYRQRFGGTPRTLYPPVTGRFPDVPWEQRRNGFVCLGRITPEKALDTVIDIVGAVRQVHPDAHLHVVGSAGRARHFRHIQQRIARHRDWITLHLDVPHEEVRRIITASRYGLHAMEDEHFGMAPAEMATGGCIVWVRDSGGQVEVVGREPRLMFRSAGEAASKILRTMASPDEQLALRAALGSRARLFAVERFVQGVRAAALEQLSRQKAGAATAASATTR